MCGILGLINKKVSKTDFKEALDRLSHRGPDGEGIWQNADSTVTLGHRRLSIIDLSENGRQPFEYRELVMTYNGEIYNYLELKKELQLLGYVFKTDSDSEVLLAAFIQWGSDCLLRFNGMWSFVIYNKSNGELFMARDRFGKKPLFYSLSNSEFCFSSEMKAMAGFLPSVEPSPGFRQMVERSFDYETRKETLLKHVYHFPAGHYASFQASQPEVKPVKYWDTLEHLVEVPKKYSDQVNMMRELILDSCKLRMRSDVPVGTALSGGLDSSAVICAMSHLAKQGHDHKAPPDWQHAYVATFESSFLDERVHAKKVADFLGVPATYINIDPAAGIEKLGDYLYYFEEIDATSPIPMSRVYETMANEGVRVSLDGHGVDEMFSGYGKSLFEIFLDTASPKSIGEVFRTYRNLHPVELTGGDSTMDSVEYFRFLFRRKKTVFRNLVKALPLVGNSVPSGPIERLGNFNYNLYLLFNQSILPTLLRNYDRYSMMNGVEIRMPFMDHRIVSFAFSLSWQSKIGGGFTKKIIRDALADIMPPDIVWRKQKIGFQTPILEYVKGPWRVYFSDTIASTSFRQSPLVDADRASTLLDGINKGILKEPAHAKELWMSVVPYLWQENFLKRITNA